MLTLCRAELYESILTGKSLDTCRARLNLAVSSLRLAGDATYLPLGLLTRAWLCFCDAQATGDESTERDLDDAWEIASHGPMRLFLADIHLYRARLFAMRSNEERPSHWASPQAELEAAEKLIKDCGYHRRDGELNDAKSRIVKGCMS
jgi:hypothetical protein